MKRLIILLLAATAAQLQADPIIIPVDVGPTRLVLPSFGNFQVDPPAGLTMNGQQVTFIYQLSKPIRLFTQTLEPFIVAEFRTNGQNFVPWGPVTGTLLDAGGNPILGGGQIIAGGGDNNFSFGPLWFLTVPSSQRPFLFYGVEFDLTMPFDPTHQIVADGSHFSVGSGNGYIGIGFGKSDLTGRFGVPENGPTVALMGLALVGLAWFNWNTGMTK